MIKLITALFFVLTVAFTGMAAEGQAPVRPEGKLERVAREQDRILGLQDQKIKQLNAELGNDGAYLNKVTQLQLCQQDGMGRKAYHDRWGYFYVRTDGDTIDIWVRNNQYLLKHPDGTSVYRVWQGVVGGKPAECSGWVYKPNCEYLKRRMNAARADVEPHSSMNGPAVPKS